MFKAEKKRAFALHLAFLCAFFFAAIAHANSEAIAQQPLVAGQSPAPKASDVRTNLDRVLPNVIAGTTANPAVTTPNKPTLTQLDKASTGEPSTSNTSVLSDLPASKRLGISVLIGILTLIAALWIGARRD